MDYTVLFGSTPDELSAKVCEYLKKNWVIQGGVSVGTIVNRQNPDGTYMNSVSFFQAMFRECPPIVISSNVIYS